MYCKEISSDRYARTAGVYLYHKTPFKDLTIRLLLMQYICISSRVKGKMSHLVTNLKLSLCIVKPRIMNRIF